MGCRSESARGLPPAHLLLLLAGCAAAPRGPEVFVEARPSVRYVLTDVTGHVEGDRLMVEGEVERRGYFRRDWATVVVEGYTAEGRPVVREEASVRMQSARMRFRAVLPYEEGLEWVARVRDSSGSLGDAIGPFR